MIIFLRGKFSSDEAANFINAYEDCVLPRAQHYFQFYNVVHAWSIGFTVFGTMPPFLRYFLSHYSHVGCAPPLCWVDKYTYYLHRHLVMHHKAPEPFQQAELIRMGVCER